MPDYRGVARRAAIRAGIDPDVFMRQIAAESGFNPTIRSPAGAIGIAQIMPATAKSWGVDPLDPVASLNAAAKNMASYSRKYGGIENALRAYNAGPGAIERSKGFKETNAYVNKILGGKTPSTPAAPATSTSTSTTTTVAAAPVVPFALPERPKVQVTTPTAPGFAAAPEHAAAPRMPEAPEAKKSERFDVGKALEAITALQRPAQIETTTATPGEAAPRASGNGKFTVSGPNPDRLKSSLVSFANKVADTYGGRLTGLDGSSHSKLTVNGNVSQHYTGNATDIFTIDGKPATGTRLLAAGRAALVAAGMDPKKARKAPGGLYNVGGHQIIFGVDGKQYGGNHLDHLHISSR